MRRVIAIAAASCCGVVLLAGCSGVRFDKAGEADAKAACDAMAGIQGDEVTMEQGFAGVASAQAYAAKAAAANDDYASLSSAINAVGDSLQQGSVDLGQAAWSNMVTECKAL